MVETVTPIPTSISVNTLDGAPASEENILGNTIVDVKFLLSCDFSRNATQHTETNKSAMKQLHNVAKPHIKHINIHLTSVCGKLAENGTLAKLPMSSTDIQVIDIPLETSSCLKDHFHGKECENMTADIDPDVFAERLKSVVWNEYVYKFTTFLTFAAEAGHNNEARELGYVRQDIQITVAGKSELKSSRLY